MGIFVLLIALIIATSVSDIFNDKFVKDHPELEEYRLPLWKPIRIVLLVVATILFVIFMLWSIFAV